MSSEAIRARNRANAKKSTGPKTAAGKAIVAGNARRHGATARPDPEAVAIWLRIILDEPEILPGDLLLGDDRGYRALALAEAEARLVTCEQSLRELESQFTEHEEMLRAYEKSNGPISTEERRALDEGRLIESRSLLIYLPQQIIREAQLYGENYKLLKRYLREARARRRKAFAAWCEIAATTPGRAS